MHAKDYRDPSLYLVYRHAVYGIVLVHSTDHARTKLEIARLQMFATSSDIVIYTPSLKAFSVNVGGLHETDISAKRVMR